MPPTEGILNRVLSVYARGIRVSNALDFFHSAFKVHDPNAFVTAAVQAGISGDKNGSMRGDQAQDATNDPSAVRVGVPTGTGGRFTARTQPIEELLERTGSLC